MGRIRSASFGIWPKGTDISGNLLPPLAVKECLKVKCRRCCKPHEQKNFASTNLKLLVQLRLYAYRGLAVYCKL